jgi:NAD(P)-dependent dehydrogenase (short-subunit alcohol dehydrogenase family)
MPPNGRRLVRVLVTGALNPVGRAVALALAKEGHQVRAFGIEPGSDPFHGVAGIECFPGWVHIGGSLEPVAAECQAIVHCAAHDEVEDKAAHAAKVEKGTLYARYAAEREYVGAFVVSLPTATRTWANVLRQARAAAEGTRKAIPLRIVDGADPQAVLAAFKQLAGKMPHSVQV